MTAVTPAINESLQDMAQVLLENLGLILATVALPVVLMLLFTGIRKGFGNAVTAMPDIFVFLASVNFYFAGWPEPWKGLVHPTVRDSFTALSVFLGLMAAALFVLVLPVEHRIAAYWVRAMWPVGNRALMPPEIQNRRFPYFGLIASWILIGAFTAVNVLAFVLR